LDVFLSVALALKLKEYVAMAIAEARKFPLATEEAS